MTKELREGVQKIGLEFSETQFTALETYISEVLEFNKTYNLMKADSPKELAVNHILDSLVAVPHIKALSESMATENASEPANTSAAQSTSYGTHSISIGDIGSGGGCPGLPLAVAFPEIQFTLVERMEKRCAFLETAVNKMQLTNVKVLCIQADKVRPESFDIVVFRAFHPFEKKILSVLKNMIKDGGYIAAYKARAEKIAEEMASVQFMVSEYKKIPLTVPFLEDHERHLVVIQK